MKDEPVDQTIINQMLLGELTELYGVVQKLQGEILKIKTDLKERRANK